jgi:CheY-like chemotaxis protein
MTNKKQTILIVEDEPGLNNAYQIILRTAGYDVASAQNGEEALRLAASPEPALILLDLRMPVMDGIEFLRRYNLRQEHPGVRVVVFSNYDMQKEIDEAYSLGAERYILKALASPKELTRLVQATLAEPKPA